MRLNPDSLILVLEQDYQLNAQSGDRFGFGFFIAAVFHLIIIFGVVFKAPAPRFNQGDLDVTLVTHFSDAEPEEADFIAQANQQASGTLDEAAVPTSPQQESRYETAGSSGQNSSLDEGSVAGRSRDTIVTTVAKSDIELEQDDEGDQAGGGAPAASARQAMLARLDTLRQEYARRPKVGTLTSVAAKAREDAEYQAHLQERIIEVGNQQYPQESIRQGIFGDLRLMLTILADGTLETTEITESSGSQMLDRAAVEIARQAAPYDVFPPQLAVKYDKIVFIRTWQFLPGGRVETGE